MREGAVRHQGKRGKAKESRSGVAVGSVWLIVQLGAAAVAA